MYVCVRACVCVFVCLCVCGGGGDGGGFGELIRARAPEDNHKIINYGPCRTCKSGSSQDVCPVPLPQPATLHHDCARHRGGGGGEVTWG